MSSSQRSLGLPIGHLNMGFHLLINAALLYRIMAMQVQEFSNGRVPTAVCNAPCPFTHVSVTVTDHCMDNNILWKVKDLAKHKGIFAYRTLNFMTALKNLQHSNQLSAI